MIKTNEPHGNLSGWPAAAGSDDDAADDVLPVRSRACAPFSVKVRRRFYRWKFGWLAWVRRQVLPTTVHCVLSSPAFVSAVSQRHRVQRFDELDLVIVCLNFDATRDGNDDGDSRCRCYRHLSRGFCEAPRCVDILPNPRPLVGIWNRSNENFED